MINVLQLNKIQECRKKMVRESFERPCGGHHSVRWQSHRSPSPVERYTRGDRGPAWVAENGGDRGVWSVIRSRKRKTMQPDDQGRDGSRVLERHGGLVRNRIYGQQVSQDDNRDDRRFPRVLTVQKGSTSNK